MFFVDINALNEFQQVGAKKTKEDEDTESKYTMNDEDEENNTNDNPSEDGTNDEPDGYSMNDADDDTPNDYSMSGVDKNDELEPTDPATETPEDTGDTGADGENMGEPATGEGNTGDDLGDGEIPDEGGEDTESDYSMDGADNGEDTGDTGTTDSDLGGDDLSGGSTGEGETEDPDQRIKEIETSINSSLTPQDIQNRDKKLKLTFVDTYKLTTDLIDKLQDLPKNEENNDEIDWLVGQASRLKGIIYDYIINNFDNKTYIQNYAIHSKYLVTLTGIKKILQQLKPKKEK